MIGVLTAPVGGESTGILQRRATALVTGLLEREVARKDSLGADILHQGILSLV